MKSYFFIFRKLLFSSFIRGYASHSFNLDQPFLTCKLIDHDEGVGGIDTAGINFGKDLPAFIIKSTQILRIG